MKLITGFDDYSADALAHLGETVAANLLTLAIFATLKPTPAAISAAAQELRNAINMVGLGRAQAIASAFAILAGLLAEVATNAPQVPNVTHTQLAEIGIPLVKTPTRTTTPPPAPQNLILRHGLIQGDVLGRCDPPDDNIRTYELQWTLDPNGSTWSEPESFPNSRSFHLSGLPRGKDIWVRVRARNSVGAGPWSDPATIMVI